MSDTYRKKSVSFSKDIQQDVFEDEKNRISCTLFVPCYTSCIWAG